MEIDIPPHPTPERPDQRPSPGSGATAPPGSTATGAPGDVRAPTDPFEGIERRGSVDYLLRNTQQQLVALTGQADLKASIIITASSLTISVAATRTRDGTLEVGVVVLLVGLLGALLSAVVAVYPKFRPRPRREVEKLVRVENPLFFGAFAELPADRYRAQMADLLRSDAAIYRAIVTDLHAQGHYLVRNKYRFLRTSYVFFFGAFVAAGLAQLVAEVV